MCPFKQKSCGSKNQVIFNKEGETFKVNMTLSPGDSCMFQVRAKCGIPSLDFDNTVGDWSNLDIMTINYDD